MSTIVKKAVVKRKKGYLYFIDGKGNVCQAKMKRKKRKKTKYLHELKIGDKFTVGGHKTIYTLTKNPGYGTYPFSYKDSSGVEYRSTTNKEVNVIW